MTRPLRVLPFAALALLLASPTHATCPSYPYPPTTDQCWQDGFCVWHDLETTTIDDGVITSDDPPPSFTAMADPVSFVADAMQGSGDLFGIVDADGAAGRSVVRGGAGGDASASFCDIPTSGVARAATISVMRVTDLVFTGPEPEVEAELYLTFDAASSQITTNVETATVISQLTALVSGAICNGAEYMTFRGERTQTLRDDASVDDQLIVGVNVGVLEDVPFDDETPIAVGPFTVPTGVPLEFELWMQTNLTATSGGGDASSVLDFALHAGPKNGGLVFELPPGYRADSSQAGIVESSIAVPEPAAALASLIGAAVLALAARAQRR